jgi:NAD(P)-dependent dehydrogenase (short-subunit alcohol dehydrogenase family)
MDLHLTGRIALITGPAKGMGAAITLAFAKEGCDLVLAGRDTDAIALVAESARSMGRRVMVVSCDLTDTVRCQAVVDEAITVFGGIDILVNVAGGSGPMGKSGWETSRAEFDEIVTLNMTGCFNTMRAVLPGMIARGEGRIVNVGGTFGMRGRAGRMAYSASKWGLRGITKSMALEAGPYGVNVNLVAPGMVDGERFRSKVVPTLAAKLGMSEDEAVIHHADEYALRRITVDEDVANACLFLASPVSRQITGVNLPVDGGWAML